jgi:hypothetical protein
MELEAVQAAGVVLNIKSSGASDSIEYYSGWEVLCLALIVAEGHAGDIDFSNEKLNDDGTSSYNRDDDDDVDTHIAPEVQAEAFAEVLQSNGADSTIDLLDNFQSSLVTDKEGYAKVYRTSQMKTCQCRLHIITCIEMLRFGASPPMNLHVCLLFGR